MVKRFSVTLLTLLLISIFCFASNRSESIGSTTVIPSSLYGCTSNGQNCTAITGDSDGTIHIQ